MGMVFQGSALFDSYPYWKMFVPLDMLTNYSEKER